MPVNGSWRRRRPSRRRGWTRWQSPRGKEVIWTLEEVAAGPGPNPSGIGEGPSANAVLDQYICSVVRFQVACSARFNDLQHTIPTAYKFHGGTIELQAWQTKTAFRSKKTPVPLLAPTYSFTGKDWWTPLMQAWDKMKELEKFKGVDYMIPTLSKDSTGVIAYSCPLFEH